VNWCDPVAYIWRITVIINRMKTVKRYTTFEDLKSVETKSIDNKASLKKHNEFEKVIKNIYSIRTGKNPVRQFR
jgi:hypothetical protein